VTKTTNDAAITINSPIIKASFILITHTSRPRRRVAGVIARRHGVFISFNAWSIVKPDFEVRFNTS
jgi:hypothetical protein